MKNLNIPVQPPYLPIGRHGDAVERTHRVTATAYKAGDMGARYATGRTDPVLLIRQDGILVGVLDKAILEMVLKFWEEPDQP